jgi:hypothetical protein
VQTFRLGESVPRVRTRDERHPTSEEVIMRQFFLSLVASLMLLAGTVGSAAPVQAQWREHHEHHGWHRDWDRDWHHGYYRPWNYGGYWNWYGPYRYNYVPYPSNYYSVPYSSYYNYNLVPTWRYYGPYTYYYGYSGFGF